MHTLVQILVHGWRQLANAVTKSGGRGRKNPPHAARVVRKCHRISTRALHSHDIVAIWEGNLKSASDSRGIVYRMKRRFDHADYDKEGQTEEDKLRIHYLSRTASLSSNAGRREE